MSHKSDKKWEINKKKYFSWIFVLVFHCLKQKTNHTPHTKTQDELGGKKNESIKKKTYGLGVKQIIQWINKKKN